MPTSALASDSLSNPLLSPYGDCAVYLAYPIEGYNREINDAVLALAARLRETGRWEDVVSGYNSLVASFNPLKMTLAKARKTLEAELSKKPKSPSKNTLKTPIQTTGRLIDVPVYYGGAQGPDMEIIKSSSGLSETDIIKLHSAEPYRVAMMGFVPGFTFLSEAPKALHHDRRKDPRLSVPSGSIGIAGWQTGIYGLSSPGGWQIIGRTPLKIFDAHRKTPFLWQAGDRLRFVPQSGPYPGDDTSIEATP